MTRKIIPLLAAVAASAALCIADTTIDPAHSTAYGANIGWIEARGDVVNGAVIGQSYCTGYLWSANCGWISLGNGPANGWQYSNSSPGDWGVNHDGLGKLSGYAYGANIGWILLEDSYGQPRVDLRSGNLSGYIYGANVGWMGLSNAVAHVRTASFGTGPDSDLDGLPDAWEYRYTNTLDALPGPGAGDTDGDGSTDIDEYRAGTNPLDKNDLLKIVVLAVKGQTNTVGWTTVPTRFYRLETTNSLIGSARIWADACGELIGPPGASPVVTNITGVTQYKRFYRVKAVIPLSE